MIVVLSYDCCMYVWCVASVVVCVIIVLLVVLLYVYHLSVCCVALCVSLCLSCLCCLSVCLLCCSTHCVCLIYVNNCLVVFIMLSIFSYWLYLFSKSLDDDSLCLLVLSDAFAPPLYYNPWGASFFRRSVRGFFYLVIVEFFLGWKK